MSQNVETVRQGVDAVNRRDPDAFVACVHPDVIWEVGVDVSVDLQGIYRGRAEVREWFERSFEVWETFHVEIEEIAEAADGRVFLGVLATARGRGGVETEARGWQVCSFADGKVMTRRIFLDRAEALEAVGLSEQDAHADS